MLDELNTKLLNLTNEKRGLELTHQTTAIKLDAKNEEVEKLIQQKKEVQELVTQEQRTCMYIYICMSFIFYCVCVCVVGKGDEGIGPEMPTDSRSTQRDPGQTGSKVWCVNTRDLHT